jgi:hypothetical protein
VGKKLFDKDRLIVY